MADPGIEILNLDGIIIPPSGALQGLVAFKIDSVGGNASLVESIAADGIFEPGESWTFAVINFVLAEPGTPSAGIPSFGSLGLDAAGTFHYLVVDGRSAHRFDGHYVNDGEVSGPVTILVVPPSTSTRIAQPGVSTAPSSSGAAGFVTSMIRRAPKEHSAT